MEKILPIKNESQMLELMSRLKESDEKYYIAFVIGVNTGMRLENILNLRVSCGQNGVAASNDCVGFEMFDEPIRDLVDDYANRKKLMGGQPLFPSKKRLDKPVCKVQFYRVLKECARSLGINGVGTQTMRKTFAWMHFKENHDLSGLRRILGTRSLESTAEYIGIELPKKRETPMKLSRKIAL